MSSIKKNYFYNLTEQLLAIILPIITIPYVTRVLGNENIGIFNYAQSIVNYFVMFGCIGLHTYAQREISFYKGNRHRQSIVFFEVVLIRLTTISLSLLVYVLTIVRTADTPLYYAVFGIEIMAALVDISWFLQGNEDFRCNASRAIITRALGMICIFLFVRSESDLWIYILCCSGAVFIGYLWLWVYVKDDLEKVQFSELHPLRHIKPALIIFLPQIAVNVYTQLDKTMLGLLTGKDYGEVGYYSQAEKIVRIALTIVTALGRVMLSRVSVAIAQEDSDAVKGYINKAFQFVHFLAWPIAVGIAAIASDFVPWFFGEGYDMAVTCMMALCPLVVIIGYSNIFGIQYMIPSKRMKEYSIAIFLGMSMNVTFNFLLIPKLGAIGAVIGTLIAEMTVLIVDYIFLHKVFSLAIFLQGYKNVIAALFMGIGVFGVANILPPTIWSTFIEISFGAVIYFLILILMRDKFFMDNVMQVVRKVLKR